MNKEAHVVIVGAGMIGLSCAYWLAKFGVEDIIVVDRLASVASGSTAHCAGVVTTNFADATMLNLARESMKIFRDIPCKMVHNGQVVLYTSDDKIEKAKKIVEVQKESHLAVEESGKKGVHAHIPPAFVEDITYGQFYRGDATVDVGKILSHFENGCKEYGVEFMLETTVSHIHKDDSGFLISTDKGKIRCDKIINAAGAHAGVIGHLAGVDIPVLPMRMHGLLTEPLSDISSRLPIVTDTHYGITILPHSEGFYLLQQYEHEEYGFKEGVEEHFIHDMLFDAEKRFPAFSSARVKESFSGYYAVTPDEKPIIGESSLSGFYCACGFNGQGFTFAPIVGLVIADLFVHPSARHAITGLKPGRFKKKN